MPKLIALTLPKACSCGTTLSELTLGARHYRGALAFVDLTCPACGGRIRVWWRATGDVSLRKAREFAAQARAYARRLPWVK